MTRIVTTVGREISARFEEILLVEGALLLSIGAWMVYLPAGLIVAGALLLGGVVLHGLGPEKR